MAKYPAFDGTQACVDSNVEDFYYEDWDGSKSRKSKNNKDFSALKVLCDSCPFLAPCLTYALHHEEYGFWGGTTEEERKKIRKQNGIRLDNPMANINYVR
jgi:hypothetical protein